MPPCLLTIINTAFIARRRFHLSGAPGGLPPQSQRAGGSAIFTEAYAVIPQGVMTDIVTSFFPAWEDTRAVGAGPPMTGFSETFSHYLMETRPRRRQ